MSKDFAGWADQKADLEAKTAPPYFHPREVWWCALGVNIGFEEDGKGPEYTRPVLILRKFGAMFLALPLSTTSKRGVFYYAFTYKAERGESVALLTHVRALDSRRLIRKDGMASKEDFTAIQAAVMALIDLK